MVFSGFPVTALEIACKIARFVNAVVDRPRQDASTNGLKRYHAAIEAPSHRICLRKLLWNLPVTDSPESEIVINALAFCKSIAVYKRPVASG